MHLRKIACTLVLVATAASAAKNYGMAGCGLGAVVIGKSGNQVIAATTNGTFANQTFGITVGSLNCTDDGVAMSDREQEMFTEANFDLLKKEIAQGQGENVAALASLMGCSATESQAFTAGLQANSANLFTDTPQNLLFSIRAVESTNNLCSTTR